METQRAALAERPSVETSLTSIVPQQPQLRATARPAESNESRYGTNSNLDPVTPPAGLPPEYDWVAWKYNRPTGNGKAKKPPINPRTGQYASPTDPTTSASYSEALCAADRFGCDGIGLILTEYSGFTVVDLDACVDSDREISTWAQAIINDINSYTEYSPSGTGIHILVEGKPLIIDNGTTCSRNIVFPTVEVYYCDHYITITGQHVAGTPETIERRQRELHQLCQRLHDEQSHSNSSAAGDQKSPKSETRSVPTCASALAGVTPQNFDQLIQKAIQAKGGSRFKQLWEGDSTLWEQGAVYGSQSNADFALCIRLAFWTGKHAKAMDWWFRRSRLMRDKWDERHYSNGDTYGQRMIRDAIAKQRTTYKHAKHCAKIILGLGPPDGLTDLERRILHFIRQAGTITRRELLKKKMPSRQRDEAKEVIERLIEGGKVIVVPGKRSNQVCYAPPPVSNKAARAS